MASDEKRQCWFVADLQATLPQWDVGSTQSLVMDVIELFFTLDENLSSLIALPDIKRASTAQFTLGSMASQSICHSLEVTYQEVVLWRCISFKIPYGNVTKKFVLEPFHLF